jgi:hypothetical protein
MLSRQFTSLLPLLSMCLMASAASAQDRFKPTEAFAPIAQYEKRFDGVSDPQGVPWDRAMWSFILFLSERDEQLAAEVIGISTQGSALLAHKAVESIAQHERDMRSAARAFCESMKKLVRLENTAVAAEFGKVIDAETRSRILLSQSFQDALAEKDRSSLAEYVEKEVRGHYQGVDLDKVALIADPRTDAALFVRRACPEGGILP